MIGGGFVHNTHPAEIGSDLIAYLDDILDGLKYGDGVYSLVSLPDTTYQNNLDEQIEYWEKLKTEIISESAYVLPLKLRLSYCLFSVP